VKRLRRRIARETKTVARKRDRSSIPDTKREEETAAKTAWFFFWSGLFSLFGLMRMAFSEIL
jgi:hypothetical protein